jgi:chemotaxis signal transduction protein
MEELPANMSGNWKEIAAGIYKLTDELLIVIDIQKLLKF